MEEGSFHVHLWNPFESTGWDEMEEMVILHYISVEVAQPRRQAIVSGSLSSLVYLSLLLSNMLQTINILIFDLEDANHNNYFLSMKYSANWSVILLTGYVKGGNLTSVLPKKRTYRLSFFYSYNAVPSQLCSKRRMFYWMHEALRAKPLCAISLS